MMLPPPPQVDTDDDLRVTNNGDSAITDVEYSIWKPPAVPSGMVGLKLKEKIAKGKFVDYDFSNFMYHSERYSKNPTMRLRDLDSIRLHNPVSEEISLLNLSSYRMNINNLNDVLYLCGGLVGMRFTSDELLLVLSKTKRLVSLWDALDECYKAMDPSCRKLIVQISDLKSHCEGGMCSDSELYVTKFHMLADEYVQELADVQSMVRMKQSSIDPSDSKDNQLRLDADPESKIGTKAPVWLSTLIELYERSRSTVDTDSGQQSRRKLNVAEFSLYLADYILSGGRQATAVSDSLSEVHYFLGFLSLTTSSHSDLYCVMLFSQLIQASNDQVLNVSNNDMAATVSVIRPLRSRRYWAARFYAFLSKMTELSSAIKDDSFIAQLRD